MDFNKTPNEPRGDSAKPGPDQSLKNGARVGTAAPAVQPSRARQLFGKKWQEFSGRGATNSKSPALEAGLL